MQSFLVRYPGVWNMLVREWPAVEDAAERAETGLREAALPFGEHGGGT